MKVLTCHGNATRKFSVNFTYLYQHFLARNQRVSVFCSVTTARVLSLEKLIKFFQNICSKENKIWIQHWTEMLIKFVHHFLIYHLITNICTKSIRWMMWWEICMAMPKRAEAKKMFVNCTPNQIPGPRLNIKTVLSTYGDFHVKDKTAVRTSYL